MADLDFLARATTVKPRLADRCEDVSRGATMRAAGADVTA
jgi:hypothetical protein